MLWDSDGFHGQLVYLKNELLCGGYIWFTRGYPLLGEAYIGAV